jgi:hypothetical protein
MYNVCPAVWASMMQTEVALRTTEFDDIGTSQSLRYVIPLIILAKYF